MRNLVKIPKFLVAAILILSAGIFWNLKETCKSLELKEDADSGRSPAKLSVITTADSSTKSAPESDSLYPQTSVSVNHAADPTKGTQAAVAGSIPAVANIQSVTTSQFSGTSFATPVMSQPASVSVPSSSLVAPASAPHSAFSSSPQQNTAVAGAAFFPSSGGSSAPAFSPGQPNASAASVPASAGAIPSSPSPSTANGSAASGTQTTSATQPAASQPPAPDIPVAYAVQNALNDPATAAQVNQILNDPGASAQLTQIANDFVANVNSSGASPSSSQYAANYNSSVSLADQQFYSTFGHEAYMAWQLVQAANAGQ